MNSDKVALNYQTKTEPMFLNQALFQLNGGSGFILKPPYMRNDESIYDVMKGKFVRSLTPRLTAGAAAVPLKSLTNKDYLR